MRDKGRERLLYTAFKESRAVPWTLLGSIHPEPSPPQVLGEVQAALRDGRDPDIPDRKAGSGFEAQLIIATLAKLLCWCLEK